MKRLLFLLAFLFTLPALSQTVTPYPAGYCNATNGTGGWAMQSCGSGSSLLSQKVVYASKLTGIPASIAVIPGSSATSTTDAAAILNAALSGGNVDLELDGGYALSTSLISYTNTMIHCTTPESGVIMQAGANVPTIINAHQQAPTTSNGLGGYVVSNFGDSYIRVSGCQLNLNATQSVTGTNAASVPHAISPTTGQGVPGVMFGAVYGLFLDNDEIYDTGSVGFFGSNVQNVRVVSNYVHQPTPTVALKNTDGIHFIGPADQLYVQNNTINAGDDSLAYNADDDNVETPSAAPAWVKHGNITNVHDDNNFLLATSFGLRLYSGTSLIDNVEVTNLHGHACGNTGTLEANSGVGPGNLGTILINGWNVPTDGTCNSFSQPYNFILSENVKSLQIAKVQITPGVSWPFFTQTAGAAGLVSFREWDLTTASTSFSNVVALNGGSIAQLAGSDLNWYDPSGSGSFFSGSVVPSVLTVSNYSGRNALLAAGFAPTTQNGDAFTNSYAGVTTYLSTTFNEGSTGANLAGTTPVTCAHGCTGTWTLPSGTDQTYQSGGGVGTSTVNAAFDVITAGATAGVLRFDMTACSGSSNICQFVLRSTNTTNKVIVSITQGSSTCIYDEVSGTANLLGCSGTGPLGNYAVTFNGTVVSVLDPNSVTIGPYTTANTTGTIIGLGAAAASSMKVTSLSVKSN